MSTLALTVRPPASFVIRRCSAALPCSDLLPCGETGLSPRVAGSFGGSLPVTLSPLGMPLLLGITGTATAGLSTVPAVRIANLAGALTLAPSLFITITGGQLDIAPDTEIGVSDGSPASALVPRSAGVLALVAR